MMSFALAVARAPCGTLLSMMVAVSFLTASVRVLVSECLFVAIVLRTIGTHEAVSFKVSVT